MKRPARAVLVAGAWLLVPLVALLGAPAPCSVAVAFHRPCPGCGLTRATLLLLHGDIADSLHMHPLAVPMIACWGMVALSTVVATLRQGTPQAFHHTRLGRWSVIATGLTYAALFALWVLRERGLFGGPVPV